MPGLVDDITIKPGSRVRVSPPVRSVQHVQDVQHRDLGGIASNLVPSERPARAPDKSRPVKGPQQLMKVRFRNTLPGRYVPALRWPLTIPLGEVK